MDSLVNKNTTPCCFYFVYIILGEADPEVERISGVKCYNVKLTATMPGSQKETATEESEKVDIFGLGPS